MKRQKDRLTPLSHEDVDFVKNVIEENEKYINVTVYNTLGGLYGYLAEEAIGDVYLLACKKVDVLKSHSCPRAWLIVAAKHVSQGLIRKHRTDFMNVELSEAENLKSDDDVAEDAVYEIWLENKIPEKLIGTLTKREREVYAKLYIECKTPKETAAELGVKVTLVNNINKNLKDKIKYAVKRNSF